MDALNAAAEVLLSDTCLSVIKENAKDRKYLRSV